MLRTVVVIAALAVSLAGCANDAPSPASFANVSVLSAAQSQAALEPVPGQPVKKTLSDKVLAAIALERVTGMKPDPGGFTH